MRRSRLQVFSFLTLLLSSSNAGADWPQSSFDAHHSRYNAVEVALDESSIGGLEVAWMTSIIGGYFASPIVVDGLVYIGGLDDRLHAYDEFTGAEIWTGPSQGSIFLGSAAYGQGLVFASASSGPMRAYDALNGDIVWSTAEETRYRAAPAVSDGIVYAIRVDGTLTAIDAETGTLIWSTAADCCAFDQSPAIDRGRVFQNRTNGTLIAYDALTGAELWTAPDSSVGTVAATGGKVIYTNNPDVVALDQASGTELWRSPVFANAVVGSPAVADGVVVVQSAELTALDEATGAVLWSAPTPGGWGPTIANGLVYASEPNGIWNAFRLADGAHIWSVSLGGCSGTCSDAMPVVTNGTLFLSGPQPNLRAYRLPLELAISGACPGEITVDVSGAAPSGGIALAISNSSGQFTLPGGSCAGTELGLESPRLLGRARADNAGRASTSHSLPAGVCSFSIQALDLVRCSTSEVSPAP